MSEDAEGPKLGTARRASIPVASFASLLAPVTPDDNATDQVGSEPQPEPAAAATAQAPAAAVGTDTPTADAKPVRPPRAEASRASEKPAKAPARAAAPARPDATATQTRSVADKGIQVSLPAKLEARLSEYKRKTGLSHPQILFSAIESMHARLPEIVSATLPEPSSGPSLFNRPPAVLRTEDGDNRVTFVLRISEENKATIDEIRQSVGASSRNAMLIAVYDAFLPND